MRPLILVSNDDGYMAPGVHRLMDFIAPYGDIVCICPDGPRSGQSMAITVDGMLTVRQLPDYNGAKMYKVNGTPVDCVKLGMHAVLKGRRPDLVCAGINHGSNSSINCVYSGTMGAAFEGCAFGIPAIGFSLTNHSMEADFSHCEKFVKMVTEKVLEHGLPDGVCLNVNIPDCTPAPTEIRMVRECKGNWSDEYREYVDPHGRPFYLLTGQFLNEEPASHDTDEWCLAHGIASCVPVGLWRNVDPERLKFTL